MIEKGEFIQDETPCYYLYELTRNGHRQTGIVACASIDDYFNGTIKKHENTREEKERDTDSVMWIHWILRQDRFFLPIVWMLF